ncbi:hypothetical protein [Chitinophaga sp. S165]|uniref:hypothetical protein n=1 Tax=Chitinophaga sp. S165 TaxID=2135462 RepID=UPI000D710948|nr:hypothetical protein [Chitinophaga sp. S165]
MKGLFSRYEKLKPGYCLVPKLDARMWGILHTSIRIVLPEHGLQALSLLFFYVHHMAAKGERYPLK